MVTVPTNSSSSATSTAEPLTKPLLGERQRTAPMASLSRTVLINSAQQGKFKTNVVRTTKYNVLSFLPLFLFESFRRYSNAFFAFIAALQQIPDVSPTGRWTTLVPLTFILFVSACKEIFEDFKRRISDNDVNNRTALVMRNNEFTPVRWRLIRVGDIVKVHSNEEFPADLILLSSSEPQGICYIETANLDGETSLKTRSALEQTHTFFSRNDGHSSAEAAVDFNIAASIECEAPNRLLHEFTGNLNYNGQTIPLNADQLLLRGARLKNSEWIYGVAVYTGDDSKLVQNSKKGAMLLLKRSQMDEVANRQIIIMFILLVVVCIISGSGNAIWRTYHTSDWYIKPMLESQNFGFSFLTFFILYNNLIPISLQVTLEMVRFFQTLFIAWDYDMYDPISDTPAVARTSNLNEDLGQIKFVFSDKTGTITENKMIFRQCSIGGAVFGTVNVKSDQYVDSNMGETLATDTPLAKAVNDFLLVLALCHTVVPEVNPKDADRPFYLASSPDEAALVSAAAQMDYIFLKRNPNKVTAHIKNWKTKQFQNVDYELLDVLDFDSDRKRMSVIVRAPTGQILLLCKGADTVICDRLAPNQPLLDVTMQHLEDFAKLGLRTLCVGSAELAPDVYAAWKEKYTEASKAMEKRKEKVSEVSSLIEKDLKLLGATAIEDRLQEGVPECIAKLLDAGMRVWVLTGDKVETAINIGYSCSLLKQDMPIWRITSPTLQGVENDVKKFRHELGDSLKKENNHIGLVIDGKALSFALDPTIRKHFLELAISMKSVLCCRVSPMQKADVVQLVRSDNPKVVTLAIGDGANDVAMIQTAHVGVGISGKEGLQAVCASDYAISQFRFLQKLLLVHGAWSYERIAKLILYCYHKNITLYIMQFYYAIASSFSGQTMFERWTIGLYNLAFTAAPPFILGIFDRSTSDSTRMEYPALYQPGQTGAFFNFRVFWRWIATALFHAAIIFAFTYFMFTHETLWSDGLNSGGFVFGAAAYTYVIMVVCLKAGLEMNSWTSASHIGIWGSILSWFIFLPIYANLWPHLLNFGEDFVGVDRALFGSWLFWFGLLLVPVVTLIFDICYKIYINLFHPSVVDRVRQIERQKKQKSLQNMKELQPHPHDNFPLADVEIGSPGRGYAFSQEENGAISQSTLAMHEDTEAHYQERLARRSRESLVSFSKRGSPRSLPTPRRNKSALKVKNL
ncbi:probable phospholipid-transporting ATPase IA [Paramacrobiotus metropolitanus]|uniref:probable phospholipid-transporting ATPase IA n=1 Tax=Paramacrobiotus metropolitanus TaxID=2943436 RepID=UPI002446152C|nr:probable phospholipid-transporting ATPase IA [Paramacrobiotus metropolitanus]